MMRRRLAVLAAAIAGVAAISGTTLAVTGPVKTYSGCLVSKDGVIIKIREGEPPTSPCSGGMVQVTFSGGDITAISRRYGTPGRRRERGRHPHAGADLPAAPDVQHGAGREVERHRLAVRRRRELDLYGRDRARPCRHRVQCRTGIPAAATATAGDAIVRTNDGTWTTEQYARAGETCPTGQFARGTATSGGLTCATPAGSGVTYVSTSLDETGIADDGANHDIVSLAPGAGTYLVIAKATLTSALNVDDFSAVGCELTVDGSVIDQFRLGSTVTNTVTEMPFALSSAAPATTGFKLRCYADSGADGIGLEDVRLIGVKLG